MAIWFSQDCRPQSGRRRALFDVLAQVAFLLGILARLGRCDGDELCVEM
jgi:hypothetical protein